MEKGFVKIPQFFDKNEMLKITTTLEKCLENPNDTAIYDDKFIKYFNPSKNIEWSFDETRTRKLAKKLLNCNELNKSIIEYFNKVPNVSKITPPHQDNWYFNFVPSNVVTLWIPIDPVDTDNGCLRYLPQKNGHHINGEFGLLKHEKSEIKGFSQHIKNFKDYNIMETQCLQPRDLIAHHGLTIHCADKNNSDRQRRVLAIVYSDVNNNVDKKGMERYMSQINL